VTMCGLVWTVEFITCMSGSLDYCGPFQIVGEHQPFVGDVLLNHKRKAGGHRRSCFIAHRLVHAVRITWYPGFYFYIVFLCVGKSTVTLHINRHCQALSSVAQLHSWLELSVLLAFQ